MAQKDTKDIAISSWFTQETEGNFHFGRGTLNPSRPIVEIQLALGKEPQRYADHQTVLLYLQAHVCSLPHRRTQLRTRRLGHRLRRLQIYLRQPDKLHNEP